MKQKTVILLVTMLFLSSLVFALPKNSVAFCQSEQYARVTNQTTYLYQTAETNESVENKWCLLPQTFFVKVLSVYNETFYKVQFQTLIGYAKKSELQLVMETPQQPFPNETTFAIKNNTSCYLRSAPKVKVAISNVLTIIPSGATVTFLGRIVGEEAIDLQGTIWYLASYQNTIGYVYSYYTNTFLPTQVNTEVVTEKLSATSVTLNPLTNANSILLIVTILVPIFVILWLLYKPVKQPKPAKPKLSNSPSNVLDSTNNFNDSEL